MPSIIELLSPLALLLPLPAADAPVTQDEAATVPASEPGERASAGAQGWRSLMPLAGIQPWHQVRIQQRVIVRVSPRRSRQSLIATLPSQRPEAFVERKIGKCLSLNDIVAVQSDASRLLLYTRDRRMISAQLEKSCRPRDFYSGFYVEPSKDGKLCIDRDNLRSRSGVSCQLSRIRQLIPAGV